MAARRIQILVDRCVGCRLCVKACAFDAVTVRERKAVIDDERCTLCGACVAACKYGAVEPALSALPAASAGGEIWVFCEADTTSCRLVPVSAELLTRARVLAADTGGRTAGVVLGHGVADVVRQAIAFGADRVYAVDHPQFEHFDDQRCAAVLARLMQARKPAILLGGATAVGRALLPRLAILSRTGLTADCTELTVDSTTGLLRQTRPAFGGNILATIICETRRPQMATVRPGVLPCGTPDPARQGEVVACPVADADLASPVAWRGFRPRAEAGVDLREAEVIVTAGYGVGSRDGVALVASLAKRLGGALGASRAVVDAGWVAYPHQVGQTGTTVQPKLYVTCGVSGAVQHLVGMQNSETIVAINRDPDAPIFEHADYAVVGDLFEIIPEWLRQLGSGEA